GDPARTPTLRALLVDHCADALALPAGIGHREVALLRGHHAGAVADRAGPGMRPRLRPVTVAGVADARRPQRDRQRGSVHGVGEVERHLGLDITTALGTAPPGCPTRATTEDGAEEIGEAGPAEPLIPGGRTTGAEQVVEV